MATLKDDETRLARYDNLSRGKKQEMDLQRRRELKKADEELANVQSTGKRVLANAQDLLGPYSDGRNARLLQENISTSAAKKRHAERKAAYEDTPRALYGDDVVHKLKDNSLTFAAGGMVRGWGKARGGKGCKVK